MPGCESTFGGYLDVKIKGKGQRGFTPWKAWHKQWCEIKRLDMIENGAELRLRTSQNGSIISHVILPRSATICRIESRSKKYAFGVFIVGQAQKALLFLSGHSESNSQLWMGKMRKFLSIATYLPIGRASFSVSLIDGEHSNRAKLNGLFGILQTTPQGICIRDASTAEQKSAWKWCEFHHFHLQAPPHTADEQRICVLHTSREFVAGQGQLYIYCEEAPSLLEALLNRGKMVNGSFCSAHRISRSEGDLSNSYEKKAQLGTPDSVRSSTNSGSDDSGVGTLLVTQETDFVQKSGDLSMAKTPGGSEIDEEDPVLDICCSSDGPGEPCIPRRESGLSLASGIYEEIAEAPPTSKCNIYSNEHIHVYEDLEELRVKKCRGIPPPLPPRVFNKSLEEKMKNHKVRSNTLPARDLKRLSQTFTNFVESEYMVMSPKAKTSHKPLISVDKTYMPMMSPSVTNTEAKCEDNYMVMNGRKN